MKQTEQKKGVKTAIWIGAAIILAGIVALAVLPRHTEEQQDVAQPRETMTTEALETQTESPAQTESLLLEVSNAYGTLRYPNKWEDQLVIQEEAAGEALAEIFYCKVGAEQYRLFTVYFGSAEMGNCLGYLVEGEQVIPVQIDCGFLPEDAALEEAQIQTFYAMMDDITVVTESIRNSEHFQATLEKDPEISGE